MAKTLIGNVKGPPGVTPHIGENGNWWIGETDTGVAATAGAEAAETAAAAAKKSEANAKTSETNAGKSASSAASSKLSAELAKTAAETAQNNAEKSATNAAQFAQAATNMANSAADATFNARNAQTAAENAQSAAASSATTAVNAANEAKGYRDEVKDLLDNAEVDPADAVLVTEQALTEAQKAQARTNINAVGKNSLTLGVHTDGLIYLFVDGAPVGNGIEQSTGVSGDVVGYVDENNNIVLTGGLADGTYNVKYEMEDGTTIDIGELALTEDGPAYTNLADPTNAEWKEGYRISSSGAEEPTAGMTLVNIISVTSDDIVRIKGMTGVVVGLYKDGAWYARKTVNATNFAVGATDVVIDGDYTQFKPGVACTNLTAIRLYGKLSGTAEDVIITVNEEITD